MSNRNLGISAVALAAFLCTAAPATGHGGLFRSPSGKGPLAAPPTTSGVATRTVNGLSPSSGGAVVVAPGSGPEIGFTEDRWEFWWEFNHDAHLDLRPTLAQLGAAVGGLAFTPVGSDERRQVLLPILLRALRDNDERVRASACYSIARLDDAHSVGFLKHVAISDDSLTVRTHAVLALGQTRSPRAVETLSSILFHKHRPDELRAYAATSLGMLSTPASSKVLRDILMTGAEDRLPYTVRVAVVYGLGLSEDRANAPALRSLAVSGLKDERMRALVVLALGRVGDRAANEILVNALQDNETQVRRCAAISLGVVAQPDDVDVQNALHRAAERDSDRMVRNFSDLSLGRIASRGPTDVVDRLVDLLRQAPSNRRGFVTLALALSADEKAGPIVLRAFEEESSHSIKGACAVSLALLGHEEARPALRKELRSSGDPMLQGYLAFALGRLGDLEVKDELRTMLRQEKSPELLRWCAVGLGLMGDPRLPAILGEKIASNNEMLTRASGAQSLGLLGDLRAVEPLDAAISRTLR